MDDDIEHYFQWIVSTAFEEENEDFADFNRNEGSRIIQLRLAVICKLIEVFLYTRIKYVKNSQTTDKEINFIV